MTRRFFRLLLCQLMLLMACALPLAARAADGIEIKRAYIESSDEGYRLAASYGFDLTHELEDAVLNGIKLYFTTEIEFTRPRWYWMDEKSIVAHQTTLLQYNVLTKQYRVSINGSVPQNFTTLDDALFLLRRPSRWLIAARGALKQGETYNVSLRMGLDPTYLAKPIMLSSLNNNGWRLSSDKKTFQYKAE